MVNRIWCETVIPILWRNPWCYSINYKKISLYSIITSYLFDDIKELLTKRGILILGQSLAFDYLSFCKNINIKVIDDIISIGSSLEYNQFLLQEEIYSLLVKKCPEIKYLNICGTYEIVYHPEAKVRLESLCELTCDTLIDSRYFYRLANICQQIQRIIIINKNLKANQGTIKLIEFQKNLKYFKWVDEIEIEDGICYWEVLEDPYTGIFDVLKKHANTLNHFDINLRYEYDDYLDFYDIYDEFDYTFLQYALLELHNLKILEIDSPIFLNDDDFNKELKMLAYRNLEILEIDFIDIYQINCMVKNSLCLRELRINDFHWNDDNFYNDSLNFIRTICKNCLLIEYLTIPVFPSLEEHFIEFEKLLKKCQKLRSLNFKEAYEAGRELEFGDYLSNVLISEASTNLREIRISYGIKFSLKTLETFLEKWKGRPAVSLYFDNTYIYRKDNSYKKLFDKYKIEKVIKYINV
ncbi:hypothetical protein GLOIN_2v1764020 [Rhizophagus irregularis DAOM 181602=DAOM 197198]|nr:hypothetical protein GLOIN_2v1764020 [Rhizophagus irregularis DAOM 181602=DAOM 197198]CAB4476660.1 unnamed protein product [Rhizophagus irregularis]